MRYSVVQPRVDSKEPAGKPAAGAPPSSGAPATSSRALPAASPSPARGANADAALSAERPTVGAPRVTLPRPRPSERPLAAPAVSAQPTQPARPARSATSAQLAATEAPKAPRKRASSARSLPAAEASPPRRSESTASAESPPLFESVVDADLVVTVAPSGWNLPSSDALVGHGAVRVAIAPGHGPGGTLMVRPLKAGEVAPRGSSVAVLVALEPDALPR